MASNVTTLEQMGEVSPSMPSTTTSHAPSQGMLTAPVFVGLSDALTQSSVVDRTVNFCPTFVREAVPAPIVITGILTKRLSWARVAHLSLLNLSCTFYLASLLNCPSSCQKT